jgi:hypothetical protein
MRDLKRNKQHIYYSLQNVSQEKDGWGNVTDVKVHGKPEPFDISVSAVKGAASVQAFGTDLKYDREMVTHDMSCPIDENTRLWLDGQSPDKPHNYEVVKRSPSLNAIRFAVRKVGVSYEDNNNEIVAEEH